MIVDFRGDMTPGFFLQGKFSTQHSAWSADLPGAGVQNLHGAPHRLLNPPCGACPTMFSSSEDAVCSEEQNTCVRDGLCSVSFDVCVSSTAYEVSEDPDHLRYVINTN